MRATVVRISRAVTSSRTYPPSTARVSSGVRDRERHVTGALLGVRTMEQLDDLMAGVDVVLWDEVLDRIDETGSPLTPIRSCRSPGADHKFVRRHGHQAAWDHACVELADVLVAIHNSGRSFRTVHAEGRLGNDNWRLWSEEPARVRVERADQTEVTVR